MCFFLSTIVIIFEILPKVIPVDYSNSLVLDYFMAKNAPKVIALNCFSTSDRISMTKEFSKKGIATLFHSTINYKELDSVLNIHYTKLGIFLDINCNNETTVAQFLREVSLHRFFNELHYWFLLANNISKLTPLMSELTFGFATDFVVAVPLDPIKYQLFDCYNLSKDRNGTLMITVWGLWTMNKGFDIQVNLDKLKRRGNMHGMPLRVGYLLSNKPPKMKLMDYWNVRSIKDGLAKANHHVLSHLSDMYNFTLNDILMESWLLNDTVGPFFRGVVNNTIDFSGVALVARTSRLYIIKFLYPQRNIRTCFIFKSPLRETVNILSLLQPMDSHVWKATIVMIIIFTISTFIVLFIEQQSEFWIRIMLNSCFIVIEALLQQGGMVGLLRLPKSIVFFTMFAFGFLFWNYYSATIVSDRLSQTVPKINDSLIEFMKLKIPMASEPIKLFNFYIQIKRWEVEMFYNNQWKYIPESQRFMTPDVGLPLMQKGHFAYHSYPENMYPYIKSRFSNREICDLTEVHLLEPTALFYATNYNESFGKLTKLGFARIAEAGLEKRIFSIYSESKPKCDTEVLDVEGVDFHEIFAILSVLIGGMTISGVLFLVEIYPRFTHANELHVKI